MKEWLLRLTLIVFGCIISIVALEYGLNKFAPHPMTFSAGLSGLYEKDKYLGWKGMPGKEKKFVRGRIAAYVKMNSHGFRDRERNYEKGKDVFRIVVLGDSFTEGLQLPLEQTFPYILEEKLNWENSSRRFEVMNLGVSGYGTAQEYLMLRHYGLRYQPDLVMLTFFIGNDIEDNSIALHPPGDMPFFVLNKGKLEKIPPKIEVGKDSSKDEEQTRREGFLVRLLPNTYYSLSGITKETPFQILRGFLSLFPNTYNSVSKRIHETPWLANFLWKIGVIRCESARLDNCKNKIPKNEIPDYYHVYLQQYTPEWQDAWGVTKRLILEIAKELEVDKIGFLVVIIPNEIEFQPDKVNKIMEDPQMRTLIDFKKPEYILSKFLEANKIAYLLLRPEFEKYTKESGKRLHFSYNYEHHWNAEGHALVAQLIYRKLKNDKFVVMGQATPQDESEVIFNTANDFMQK